ncbi:MAG TPA: thiamine pyrophosphate-binding protein [Microbacterium sp.]|nr:thiamine pyrophosphate-binding protein [Microbacterium sp.]
MVTVSEAIADELASRTDVVFGVMGNGNAHVVSRLTSRGIRYVSARHEGGALAMADAYYRASGRMAVATTTYGPGFTNTLTALGEATQARVPILFVTGDAPSTGARPVDIDQKKICEAIGVEVVTVTSDAPRGSVRAAWALAQTTRRPVVLAIPYDFATAQAPDEEAETAVRAPLPQEPPAQEIDGLTAALSSARRPLILVGRGAILAEAVATIRAIGDRIGALFATSVMARNAFDSPWDLGIAGGFARARRLELIREADLVVTFGAALNTFQTREGHLFENAADVIAVSLDPPARSGVATHHLAFDARAVAEALLSSLESDASSEKNGWRAELDPQEWRIEALTPDADEGEFGPDGRLDPRRVARVLNEILPAERTIAQDGGHFLGWMPMYASVPDPQGLIMSGTAFQVIGLGFPFGVGAALAQPDRLAVLISGDGGGLMALPDLETFIRVVPRGVVVVFNDAAYGAELHQYASRGLHPEAMLIDEVDFAAIGRSLGAEGVKARAISDLEPLRQWVESGSRGVFVLDVSTSRAVVAAYMAEVVTEAASDEWRAEVTGLPTGASLGAS